MRSFSVVIPTLNEEKYLPKLLESIQKQTLKPDEIIVADSHSQDKTREIAKEYGCKITDGGSPAKARNHGATVATSSVIVFLDADVILQPTFFEKNMAEFEEKKFDIASCCVAPLTHSRIDGFWYDLATWYFRIVNVFQARAFGNCIFAKKSIHDAIRGFDETLKLAEDHDYVARARKIGTYGYLTAEKVPVSNRRFLEEGRFSLAEKYAFVELQLLFLGKIKKNVGGYIFGKHVK